MVAFSTTFFGSGRVACPKVDQAADYEIKIGFLNENLLVLPELDKFQSKLQPIFIFVSFPLNFICDYLLIKRRPLQVLR